MDNLTWLQMAYFRAHDRSVRKIVAFFVVALAGICLASIAMAQASLPVIDPQAALLSAQTALANHAYVQLGAAVLMLGIWALSKFGVFNALNPKLIPWVSVGLALVGATCYGLTGGHNFSSSLGAGIEAGLSAVAQYEAVGQHFLTFGPAKA